MTADLRREEIARIAAVLHDNGVACEMHSAPRSFTNAHEVHATRLLDVGLTFRSQDTALASVLSLHYITAIECDHETKQDTVRCNCSVWTGTPQPSVGAAVQEWVDHVRAVLSGETRMARIDPDILEKALEANRADFLDQPDSYDHPRIVSDNIARHYDRLSGETRTGGGGKE